MQPISIISSESALERIRSVLRMIDAPEPPSPVRPHVETSLVRQVAKIMDHALPWQQGHGRRTTALAQAIGTVAGLCQKTLHHLTLAALLHDIGLLALPNGRAPHTGYLDASSLRCRPMSPATWSSMARIVSVPEACLSDYCAPP
jgi:HD-GYP domain-containing protein (c-di-GMP phosphodiesterase class II)